MQLWPGGDRRRAREIGRVYVANQGGTRNASHGNYKAAVCRRGTTEVPAPINPRGPKPTRAAEVLGYARKANNVWRLGIRVLLAVFPEERARATSPTDGDADPALFTEDDRCCVHDCRSPKMQDMPLETSVLHDGSLTVPTEPRVDTPPPNSRTMPACDDEMARMLIIAPASTPASPTMPSRQMLPFDLGHEEFTTPIVLSDADVERIAQRAAEIVLSKLRGTP